MVHRHGPPGRQTRCCHLHQLQCCVRHGEPVIPWQCPSGNRGQLESSAHCPGHYSPQQLAPCALDNRMGALICRNHSTSREACCRGISSRRVLHRRARSYLQAIRSREPWRDSRHGCAHRPYGEVWVRWWRCTYAALTLWRISLRM